VGTQQPRHKRLNLDGYKWNDNSPISAPARYSAADPLPFTNLIIHAGESILFVETVVGVTTNEAQFRSWWGTNLGRTCKSAFMSGTDLVRAATAFVCGRPTR